MDKKIQKSPIIILIDELQKVEKRNKKLKKLCYEMLKVLGEKVTNEGR